MNALVRHGLAVVWGGSRLFLYIQWTGTAVNDKSCRTRTTAGISAAGGTPGTRQSSSRLRDKTERHEKRLISLTGAQTNSATAYSKNYHFWQKFSDARRATPTRIASHGAPQARKQAILGDLGRYSTKAASKMPPTKSYSVGLPVLV